MSKGFLEHFLHFALVRDERSDLCLRPEGDFHIARNDFNYLSRNGHLVHDHCTKMDERSAQSTSPCNDAKHVIVIVAVWPISRNAHGILSWMAACCVSQCIEDVQRTNALIVTVGIDKSMRVHSPVQGSAIAIDPIHLVLLNGWHHLCETSRRSGFSEISKRESQCEFASAWVGVIHILGLLVHSRACVGVSMPLPVARLACDCIRCVEIGLSIIFSFLALIGPCSIVCCTCGACH